jgi:transcriptional regulator with XRE-family HTH domain
VEERFRDRLQHEFDQRRQTNKRYSLRAFATFLGTDHSSLSQILKSQRSVPLSRIRSWARKLGLSPEVTATYLAAEHLPDSQTTARQNQVRHWTAEASAIILQPVHWDIFRLCRTRSFRSDSRWVAEQCGTTVDEVNVAFARLLRLGLVATLQNGRWVAASGTKASSEREFQKTALTRVREKAAEDRVKLPVELSAPRAKGHVSTPR